MAVITANADILTLIITIDVEPENCARLVDLIERTTTEFISRQPGFVSANLHTNADSTRIVNYGQWETPERYAEARALPEFVDFSDRVAALADRIDPVPCRVVYSASR